jgi:hypothetical protein
MILVNLRKQRFLAVGVSLAITLATVIPYLLAARNAPLGYVFSGFMMNPIDGFSYLAKMRQGLEGFWLFRLPYAAEPGPGALLFTFHILLGHIARWLRSDLLYLYHLARVLAGWGMFVSAYVFLEELLDDSVSRWAAFLFILLGSGLGWIASAFGVFANDLWIPESIPFLTAYTNAHFPAAAALLLLAMRSILRRQMIGAAILSLALSLIQPFAAVLLVGTTVVWGLTENRSDATGTPLQWRDLAPLLVGTAPVLLYDLWVTTSHRVLSSWSAQNVTPTPPLLETALGFGFILVLAIIGAIRRRAYADPKWRLSIIWVILSFVAMYLPIALQRRMVFGLFFPLAALAGLGIYELWGRSKRFGIILVAVLIFIVPSNLVVMAAGLSSAREQSSPLLMSAEELAAYEWMSANLTSEALILAGQQSGNRIPAFSSVRVIYGHPFETPDADQNKDLVSELYEMGDSAQLRSHGINFVLLGPNERDLGDIAWMEELQSVYHSDSVQIFQVAH